MNTQRRTLIGMAGLAPALALAGNNHATAAAPGGSRLVLTDFQTPEPVMIDNCAWRGFSDRVMGGVSDGNIEADTVAGKRCLRMTGRVTKDSGGGFIQMAMYLGGRGDAFDASAYAGLEFLIYGNNEDYNIHIRTADVRWYSQSYRATFFAQPRWQKVRLPWSAFVPNQIDAPLNVSAIQRVGLLGWMREFEADLSVGEVALYA
ncbi:MAG: CIA30 family protein [Gammaproteobacteria bacterium]